MSYNFNNSRKRSKKKIYFVMILIILVVWVVVAYKGVPIQQNQVIKTIDISSSH